MRNTEYTVNYNGKMFIVWRDGAGLDMMATADTTPQDLMDGAGHDLFMNLVDIYNVIGLESALEKIGAVIIMVKESVGA
jgi:hypothetical protein